MSTPTQACAHRQTHQTVWAFKTPHSDSQQLTAFISEGNSVCIPFGKMPFKVLKQSQLQFRFLLSRKEEIASIHKVHTTPARNKECCFAHLKALLQTIWKLALSKPFPYTVNFCYFISIFPTSNDNTKIL